MDSLKIEKVQYFMMMQSGSLKCVGCPPSWIVKIKLLMGGALERYFVSTCQILVEIDHTVAKHSITIFCIFLVKCKKIQKMITLNTEQLCQS